jgi:CRISPR/Cas system-associated protein Cas5 (RAMP superfamily)
MQSAAERARARRQLEEEEREKERARARKKAAELEEKSKSAEKEEKEKEKSEELPIAQVGSRESAGEMLITNHRHCRKHNQSPLLHITPWSLPRIDSPSSVRRH